MLALLLAFAIGGRMTIAAACVDMSFADQVEPAARIVARILRGCHRTAPLAGGRYVYVCCGLRCDV